MTLSVGSLFAGLGGFDLGFERAGMQTMWQVEIDDYATRILEKHWPRVRRFRDVRECGAHNLDPVDVICGGFPCQPYSVAGKQGGEGDDRHLWPEMLRIVQELEPRWVVGENVPGIYNIFLNQTLVDLEDAGYEVWPVELPACAFEAPHIRRRVFFVAYSDGAERIERGEQCSKSAANDPDVDGRRFKTGQECNSKSQVDSSLRHSRGHDIDRLSDIVSNSDVQRCEEPRRPFTGTAQHTASELGGEWASEPRVGRVVDGVPTRVDRARVRCLGNAVMPQVAEFIGGLIVQVEGM